MPRKVMVIFGTRPEAIKLAPVISALNRSLSLCPCICVTGQHREVLDQMLRFFEIVPEHDLAVMSPDQPLAELTARLLRALQPVLAAEKPDAIVVQGDTTTTLAAALAGYYAHIPSAHVEAGLRTGDPYNPFPEEMNRRLIGQLATWHFAPTLRARANLEREGVPPERVVVTGNTIVDAFNDIRTRLEHDPLSRPAVPEERLAKYRLILATSHRRESFGEGLHQVCVALRNIADRNPGVLIVYPVHLNPQVRGPVHRFLEGHPRILLTPPLEYCQFVDLMRRAYLILTDSGGVQEEAPLVRVPVLVLRSATERSEGIEAGVARLVGTAPDQIVAAAEELLHDRAAHGRMATANNLYGDGHAADAIVTHLQKVLLPP